MAQKKELNSELELMPFMSLLSVMICSLLLSAMWVQIGTMNAKQAIGGQPHESNEKSPVLFAKLLVGGGVEMQVMDGPAKLGALEKSKIQSSEGKIDSQQMANYLAALRGKIPNLKSAIIQPEAEIVYQDLIVVMDDLKKNGLVDLGVSPL